MVYQPVDWKAHLLGQADFYWDHHLIPRLQGLDDAEYLWEPVANCWTVHRNPDGSFRYDRPQWPEPAPPPFTTIAWRITHLTRVFGIRASNQFGDCSATDDSLPVPGTAADAIVELTRHHRAWRDGMLGLSSEELARPCGPTEGPYSDEPLVALIQHIHREFIHHGSEICLLRDLYRYRASLRPGAA